MPLSLFGLLEQRAQVSPHAEGFVDERYRLTFSGMIHKVDQLSQLPIGRASSKVITLRFAAKTVLAWLPCCSHWHVSVRWGFSSIGA